MMTMRTTVARVCALADVHGVTKVMAATAMRRANRRRVDQSRACVVKDARRVTKSSGRSDSRERICGPMRA
jgi:hypothetical protein